MGEGAKRTRVMLRTLNNSSLAPDQDEASSYRAVEFRVARRKLWHENDFHSRRKNNTGPKRRLGTRSPVVSPIRLAPRNAFPAAHQHATSALGRGELCRKFDFNFAQHRCRREIRTPCIRGMRVTVGMIVEALAAGRTIEQLLFDFPYLEEEDIREAVLSQNSIVM